MKHCTGCWPTPAITSDRSCISRSCCEGANGNPSPFLMATRTNTTATQPGRSHLRETLRLDRPVQHDFEGSSRFQDEIFAARQQNRGGSGCRSPRAADGSALALIRNDTDQCSFSGGGAHGFRIFSLAGIALYRRFTLSVTSAAGATKRGIDRNCDSVRQHESLKVERQLSLALDAARSSHFC